MTQPLAPFVSPPAAFLTQTVCLDDTTVKFEIWDTAGQERYHSLAPMYYRGAQAAIVVYDITNEVPRPAPPPFEITCFVAPQRRRRGSPSVGVVRTCKELGEGATETS